MVHNTRRCIYRWGRTLKARLSKTKGEVSGIDRCPTGMRLLCGPSAAPVRPLLGALPVLSSRCVISAIAGLVGRIHSH